MLAAVVSFVEASWQRHVVDRIRRHDVDHRLLWAARFALLGCFPAALFANMDATSPLLTQPSLLLSFIVVTTAGTCGRGFANLFTGLKIVGIGLVLVWIVLQVDIGRHWAAWGVVLSLGVFCIALLTEFVVTMNSMLMFLIGMCYAFLGGYGGRERQAYAWYQARDVLLGTAFGVCSSTIPFRSEEYVAALKCSETFAQLFGRSLSLLADAVMTDSHARRTAAVMQIRRDRQTLDSLLARMEGHIQYAWFEPVNGLKVAQLVSRLELYTRLQQIFISMIGLVEVVRTTHERQWTAFLTRFRLRSDSSARNAVVTCAELLLDWVVSQKTALDQDRLGNTQKALLDSFCPTVEANVTEDGGVQLPLQPGSFVKLASSRWGAVAKGTGTGPPTSTNNPAVGNGNERDNTDANRAAASVGDERGLIELCNIDTLLGPPNESMHSLTGIIDEDVVVAESACGYFVYMLQEMLQGMKQMSEPEVWSYQRKLMEVLKQSIADFRDTMALVKNVFQWGDRGKRKVIFSVKLAVCITAFISYLLNKHVGDPFFGPAQMAFAAGLDSSKAVSIFGSQVIGCILGNAIGFLLSMICTNPSDFVLWITLSGFATGFFRSSSDYGLIAIYVQFAMFGSLRPWPSSAAALGSIMTNTAAMGLYVAAQLLVLPANPLQELQQDLIGNLLRVAEALHHCHRVLQCQNGSFSLDGMTPSSSGSSLRNKDLSSMFREIEASVRRQLSLLPSAAQQPRLSPMAFPSHLFEKLIQRELDLLRILHPLATAWKELIVGGLEFEAPQLAACVASASEAAETFLKQLASLASALDESTQKRCMESIADSFSHVESCQANLMRVFRRTVQNVGSFSGSSITVRITDAHLLDTVMYCCDALSEALFHLFQSFDDVHVVIRGLE